ncbi:MAG: NAD(P)/FAD-dependent oxidoreductase [Candidatus Limnocylindria bacterium]
MTEHTDAARLPAPGARRSWWLREALEAEGQPMAAAPLGGAVECDVAIVGGGYTGMWTAYDLTERAPGVRIVMLEQDICGGGPSGRNGGFVHAWWDQLPLLVDLHGPDRALEMARASETAVSQIGAFCSRHGVDAWFVQAGYLQASASPAQDGDWDRAVAVCRELGAGDAYQPVSEAEVQARCASPRFRSGVLMPSGATVQPALLARGLRRVLLERGVIIHEGTRVQRLEPGDPVRLETDGGGEVRAPQVVLGINAWAAGWPGFRTRLMTWGSYIVLTEPIPDRLEELRWTGGEAVTDSRFTIHYFRTTRDGRIAFGAGVGAAGYGGAIGRRFTDDRGAVSRAAAGLRHLFPMLADVRIEDAWGGPIDISSDRLPAIGSLHGGRVHFAHGYSGNGVGPSRLAGRILAAIVDGGTDPIARLPIVGARARRFPPEPFRYVGARMIREALVRKDEAEDQSRRPSLMVRSVARLPRLLGYRIGH